MVDWVNPPGSIYCLYYLCGHLRLFTLRLRKIPIICVSATKSTRDTRIREPDSKDEEKKTPKRKARR